jgi:hypothetical protein
MTKLAVWTPSISSMFASDYVRTVIGVQSECISIGFGFEWGTIPGVSILPIARNRAVNEFLKGDATHFMFLDSDVGAEAADIIACVESGVEFSALPYSRKNLDSELIVSIIRNNPAVGPEAISSVLSGPALQFNGSENNPIEKSLADIGFIECDRVGTGAMILKRSVFEKMSHIVDEYIDRSSDPNSNDLVKNYFGYSKKDGVFVGEDWTFCDNWKSIGGAIYLKLNAKTTHEGSVKYRHDIEALMQ